MVRPIYKRKKPMARYIKIPKDVVIDGFKNAKGDEATQGLVSLIRFVLVNDNKVCESPEALDKFDNIQKAFMKANADGKMIAREPGEVVELEADLFEFFQALILGAQYNPEMKISMLPLLQAVTKAAREKPADDASAKASE
jgi:hypothetical protein